MSEHNERYERNEGYERNERNEGYERHERNRFEQAGDFAVDAGIDTAANNIANGFIDGIASHIPGGRAIEPMIETEADLMLDNSINRRVKRAYRQF